MSDLPEKTCRQPIFSASLSTDLDFSYMNMSYIIKWMSFHFQYDKRMERESAKRIRIFETKITRFG